MTRAGLPLLSLTRYGLVHGPSICTGAARPHRLLLSTLNKEGLLAGWGMYDCTHGGS
jgi:hypothetical protein